MTELFKQIANYMSRSAAPDRARVPGVAQNLMERAGADAGRNPIDAAQLRDAARAFLAVVR